MHAMKFAQILPSMQMKCELRDFQKGMALYSLKFLAKFFITEYLN